jgi:signal transduction histidine kinase
MLDFAPHGVCYLWDRNLVILHVASDSAIALAYLCLPLLLWHFIRKRPDIPFSWLFVMFGGFILSCGATHLMSVWTVWHPDYWQNGIIKAATAGISLTTAIALFLHLPQAIALPSPAQMTEKERQLEEALKKEREINEFRKRIVATVSHEYRTPLTTILSSVELLERYVDSQWSDRTERHFNAIKRKVAYLTSLIEDALILDRAESGKLEFQPVEMDAIAYCQELSSELDWNEHILHLTVEGEATGLFDPRLLNALFTNLVYNAYKYSAIRTTVFIRLRGIADTFTLEVEDQGIGIPAEDIPRIFESYFRATNAESLPGTGVGLAIVSKCVNLHGGAIAVESTVGVGTTFRVVLPLRHGVP